MVVACHRTSWATCRVALTTCPLIEENVIEVGKKRTETRIEKENGTGTGPGTEIGTEIGNGTEIENGTGTDITGVDEAATTDDDEQVAHVVPEEAKETDEIMARHPIQRYILLNYCISTDRRDHKEDRREKGEKDHRKKDDGRDRDRERERDRDERKTTTRRDDNKVGSRQDDSFARETVATGLTQAQQGIKTSDSNDIQARVDPVEVGNAVAEDGEEMDAVDDNEAAMMAAMGLQGFGTTKGKHVTGNQEGTVSIKKMRTWRQYMNRRGGFNRPLDKIK
ncbi:hypothetical protein APHAL10511_007055 [Amanita phalloides]|nr:hypothetical protein APHAL10511_007055 [Amanita phalloides]